MLLRLHGALQLLLLCLSWAPPTAGKLVGVWIDVEGPDTPPGTGDATVFTRTLAQASSIARKAGLRFAVDAMVGWTHGNMTNADHLGPPRPIYQQVMDIVDEITVMDYFDNCSGVSNSTPCPIHDATHNAVPFLAYADQLRRRTGRRVLVDIGLIATTYHGSFRNEFQIESYLEQAQRRFLRPNATLSSAFNKFAFFEYSAYLQIVTAYPCVPAGEPPCSTAAAQRPGRALWTYEMLNSTHGEYPPRPWRSRPECYGPGKKYQCDLLFDSEGRRNFFAWCKTKHVNELYVQFVPGQPNSPDMLGAAAAFVSFVSQANALGIDVQAYSGDNVRPCDPELLGMGCAIVNYTASAAEWCGQHKALCGSTPPRRVKTEDAEAQMPCVNVTDRSSCGKRCDSLTLADIKPRTHEVTAYHSCGYGGAVGDEWKRYDWSKLTTVAPFCPWGREGNYWGLVCAAHEHGVRVINWYRGTDKIETCAGLDVLNETAVDEYVKITVNDTSEMGQDGLLFDIEGTRHGCWHYPQLSDALIRTADAMHQINPASIVMYSSSPHLHNRSSFNASTRVDFRRLSEHFDVLQPMEYCSLDNGTAGCAPVSWVNRSLQTYLAAGITTKGKAMPIFPWIGPTYTGCLGNDCSMQDDPDNWNGFPGCITGHNYRGGWQMCPALGFGQLMALLPNSSHGLEWSDRWQQPFFNIPPATVANVRAWSHNNVTNISATIWIDNPTSMAPKYEWAIEKWGGFGIWTADAAGVEERSSGGAPGQAMWDAIPSPYLHIQLKSDDTEEEPRWFMGSFGTCGEIVWAH
jgi:hypothetical protein